MNRHVAASTARSQPIHIGDHLREWRQRRHLSQLDLATDAEISARHLSFVETGRATPSRDMVLRLAERLDVPLEPRDWLLLTVSVLWPVALLELVAEVRRRCRWGSRAPSGASPPRNAS